MTQTKQSQINPERYAALKLKQGKSPLTIIAEGDSWFQYSPAGKDTINKLEKLLDIDINNLASPGHETGEMLTGEQKARLERELKRGPAHGRSKRYDIFLFSGGGNDLVGKKTFYKWFHDYEKDMTANELLNKKAIKGAFGMLEVNYNILFKIRDTFSPETHLLLNTYDFAIPNGDGVCFKGPWLEPGLNQRNVPRNMEFRTEVVKLFLIEFEKLLSRLAKKNKLVTVIQTQGTLIKKEWANELHPTYPGFGKIAKVFETAIKNLPL